MPNYPSDTNDTVLYNGTDVYVPKDSSVTVFEDSRLFLFGEIYLNGQPVLTGGSFPSGIEAYVGPTQPVDSGVVLWWDINAGTYGELKVKVGGSWKTVEDPTDTSGDEVYVGSTAPVGGTHELWVDTSSNVIKAKVLGSWVAFPGPTGPAGTNGTNGSNGLNGDWSTPQPINTQSGATYTLVLSDAGKIILTTSSGGQGYMDLTIPTNATAAFPVGSRVDLLQGNSAYIRIGAAGGVTLRATPSTRTRGQWSAAGILKIATDEWVLMGDLYSV